MKFEALAKSFAIKQLPESEIEISGEIPFDTIAPYRERALAHLAEHLELPGFRPGKVPAATALQKVGEIAVLEEAVELFAKEFYPELIETHHLDPVGRPDIRLTKLAPNNPVGLSITAAIYPQVTVPTGWKKLFEQVAAEEAAAATDEEVDKTLEELRQSRMKPARPDDSGHSGGDDKLPELNDEFAKSVGAFTSLENLKEQIKKGIGEEKAREARDKRRGKLIEKLLQETSLSVPRIFIESELEKIVAQMREDVQRFGMTFDEYLKKINKTEEVIRSEFREQAMKRAKLQLVLNKIAEEEKLEADPTAVDEELKHALEHFPDARPELVRIHIKTIMRNEKALKLLEGETTN
jgi:FKBP-type peptidyl-prolyl cis-trans isomerase (trigger factor)